jgi:hypothetical protein
MAIKLDMNKAYDWVEWLFLEGIMRKLGFAEAWISLIMTYVAQPPIQFWLTEDQ